jgi:hypothetical protein
MRISLQEIWNFIALLEAQEKGWTFTLNTGKWSVENLQPETLLALKEDAGYDTEILPSLFTFREILWQPDVFTKPGQSLPPLRVLKAFCEETVGQLDGESQVQKLYAELLAGMGHCCEMATQAIEEEGRNVTDVLGEFRTCTFPIIKFFIFHPMNRKDYFDDACKRLNYAVKIMLTQFYGLYTELAEPYWVINYEKPVKQKED